MEQKLFKYYIQSISSNKTTGTRTPVSTSHCLWSEQERDGVLTFISLRIKHSITTNLKRWYEVLCLVNTGNSTGMGRIIFGWQRANQMSHVSYRSRWSKTPFLSLKLLATVAYTIWIATCFVIHFEDKLLRNETKWGLMKKILSWNWPWGKNRQST